MTKTREARLRSKAHQAFRETFPEKKCYRLDRYHIWLWMILTGCGKKPLPKEIDDEGRLFFYHHPFKGNPWAKRLASLKPNQRYPRILVTGTLGREPKLQGLIEKVRRHHGLGKVNITYNRDIARFWDKFYGTGDFFTQKAKDIPTLIIMANNGDMKNRPREGGEWLNMTYRLTEIADFYKIPIEPLETYQN